MFSEDGVGFGYTDSFPLTISSLCLCSSFRSTSLTLMMRITSLIRMSSCTKLGRYGTLLPVLQIRLCLARATTKVCPTTSFCLFTASLCFFLVSLLFLFYIYLMIHFLLLILSLMTPFSDP